jgi:hypothetical protein
LSPMIGIAVPVSSLIPRASGPLYNEHMIRGARFPGAPLLDSSVNRNNPRSRR